MDKKSIIFLGISILILVVMLYFVGINDVINAKILTIINILPCNSFFILNQPQVLI